MPQHLRFLKKTYVSQLHGCSCHSRAHRIEPPPQKWPTHLWLTNHGWRPSHCCCTGLTDAYDLYMVGVITPMIAFARFSDHVKGGNLGSLPDEYDLVVKGMALVGTLVGQVRVVSCSITWSAECTERIAWSSPLSSVAAQRGVWIAGTGHAASHLCQRSNCATDRMTTAVHVHCPTSRELTLSAACSCFSGHLRYPG